MRGDIAAAICGKKASERQGALFDVLVFLLSDLADSFSLAIFLSPDLDKVMLKGKSRKNQKNRDARSEQNKTARPLPRASLSNGKDLKVVTDSRMLNRCLDPKISPRYKRN
jgi:hypothetical protein